MRIGADYSLGPNDTAEGLVVIAGSATVAGHVTGDLVVVLGDGRLASSAVVDGEVVVVGGNLTVADGALVRRGMVLVGGALDAPPTFKPGGEQVVLGFRPLGNGVRAFLPWLSGGLLLGRPLVPDLPWVWALVGVAFLVYLALLLVFDGAVRTSTDFMTRTPLTALATGLAVLLLTGPVCLLLAASVIGLAVVPFALCAVLVAALLGKIAVVRWLGMRLVAEGDERRPFMVRSFVIGSALLCAAYLVPVFGGVVWALATASGLGAATLAFVAAYRRENPPAAPRLPQEPPPLPPPVPSDAAVSAGVAAPAPDEIPPGAKATGAVPQDMTLFPRAGFMDRVAAFVIDAILVGIATTILGRFVDHHSYVLLFLAYRSAFWAWKGTTVGGIICQLRVIRTDGALVGGTEAVVRGLGSIFSIAVLGIGCLWVLRDEERQAWHDKIASTYVVKVPRTFPL